MEKEEQEETKHEEKEVEEEEEDTHHQGTSLLSFNEIQRRVALVLTNFYHFSR